MVGAATGGVDPQQKLQGPNVIVLASASFQLLAPSAFRPPEPLSLVIAVRRLGAESVYGVQSYLALSYSVLNLTMVLAANPVGSSDSSSVSTAPLGLLSIWIIQTKDAWLPEV